LKLPRDLSGSELAHLLKHFGYETMRQTGSHIRLRSIIKGNEHHITIPAHENLKVGTLASILADVAEYLDLDRQELLHQLFGP
jgi:predicted RNA binding protein YcfA (HicA-like mRNA interferase family)